MTLLDAQEYDQEKARKRRQRIVSIVVLLLIVAGFVWWNRNWPEERIVRGTLGDIAAKTAAERIERTALIIVGDALAAEDFRESALYDAAYQRRFRAGGTG